jgi:hypothetical protein
MSERGGRRESRSRSAGPRLKRGLGEVNVNEVAPEMEIYRSLAERGFEKAEGGVLTVQDLLCSGVNASNISAALRDIDEDKIIDCLKRAVNEISKEFETRDRIRWPYMLLTARFRRELRAAGARALPFDGETKDRSGRGRSRSRGRDHGRSRSPLSSRDRRLVEDFIDHNRLDRRSAEVLKYELSSRDMHRVIDEGFTIRASNASREVMLRIKDVQSASHQRRPSYRRSSRSRSPHYRR